MTTSTHSLVSTSSLSSSPKPPLPRQRKSPKFIWVSKAHAPWKYSQVEASKTSKAKSRERALARKEAELEKREDLISAREATLSRREKHVRSEYYELAQSKAGAACREAKVKEVEKLKARGMRRVGPAGRGRVLGEGSGEDEEVGRENCGERERGWWERLFRR